MNNSLLIISIFLTGCTTLGLVDVVNKPTRVDPLPVKTAIKNSSVVIGIPVVTRQKPTGGYRSIVDIETEIFLTQPVGLELPLMPNGFTFGVKYRK